jgi:hypothetical protein
MKKLVFLMFGILLMSSCGKSESEFDEELNQAYIEMSKTIYASALVCDKISSTWQKAIFDNRTPSGAYCSDFNDALKELTDTLAKTGIVDSIETWNKNMQVLTSKMNDAPKSRKECYDDFVSIVSDASSYSRMATSPSGSLKTYNENNQSTSNDLLKKLDQFKIKYGKLLKDL